MKCAPGRKKPHTRTCPSIRCDSMSSGEIESECLSKWSSQPSSHPASQPATLASGSVERWNLFLFSILPLCIEYTSYKFMMRFQWPPLLRLPFAFRTCDEIFMITYSAMPLLLFTSSLGHFFLLSRLVWVVSECVPLQSIMHKGKKKNIWKHCEPYVSAELWHFAFRVYVPNVKVCLFTLVCVAVCVCVAVSIAVCAWNGEGQFGKQYARLFVVPLLCHHYECFSIQNCKCVCVTYSP